MYDINGDAARAFANRRRQGGISCTISHSVGEDVNMANIVVTATWARSLLLRLEMLSPGMHITTLGPDSPGKVELGCDVLEAATLVCDDVAWARSMGCLSVWPQHDIRAITLGAVLRDEVPGRQGSHVSRFLPRLACRFKIWLPH